MSRKLVISPSGNFYGSEQVLFDYLQHTKLTLDVAVPRNSLFFSKVKEAKTKHRILPYNNKKLRHFYAKVFWLLFTGKYDLVYLNEAGHVRYLMVLARLFRKRKFIIHVRMLEDSDASRWKGRIPDNLTVLAISKYISEKLPVKSMLLYDAYPFSEKILPNWCGELHKLRVAIIGRITKTKGLSLLPEIIDQIWKDGSENEYIFELYGETADDILHDDLLAEFKKSKLIVLKGFETNNESIYHSADCILHLSKQEALGRIFFEAIDHFKPLVGFKAAGIGEIAELLQLEHWMADSDLAHPASAIYRLLKEVKQNYENRRQETARKKIQAIQIFNPVIYRDRVDQLLSA